MCCIICYQEPIIGINLKIQARKGLISYYKTNEITSFKKHVDVDHNLIAKMFEEEVNSLLKGREERQLAKKKMIMSSGSNVFLKTFQRFFKKEDLPQNFF
jgi:hypothetical protein